MMKQFLNVLWTSRMRCRALALVACVPLVTWMHGMASAAAEPLSDAGASSVTITVEYGEDGPRVAHKITETRYSVILAYHDCKASVVLLKSELQTSTTTIATEFATQVDRLTITATHADEGGASKPLYVLDLAPGAYERDAFETADIVLDRGYISVLVGGGLAPYRVFDPWTGRLLAINDDGRLIEGILVDGECEERRLVALSTHRPDLFSADTTADNEFVAAIAYAALDGTTQEARIDATAAGLNILAAPREGELLPRAWFTRPGTRGKRYPGPLPAHASDAQTFEGFAIWVKLTKDHGVEIPITADRMDLARAVLPDGFSIALIGR